MNSNEHLKEISVIILATIVLAITAAFKTMRAMGADSPEAKSVFYAAALCFLIILVVNIAVKKMVGYYFQTDVKTKFWTWYQYGFRKDWHFKKPLPMLWVPLLVALITRGYFLWLAILEFDVVAKTERVAKKHGLYRFTEVTEHHVAWIAIWALIANFVFAVIAYILTGFMPTGLIAGFELFTKLSIYFIAWSVIPLSGLDGSKILFGGRVKWFIYFIAAMILLIWALIVL